MTARNYFVLIFLAVVTTAMAQRRYNDYYNNAEKPGSCPPLLPVEVCSQVCAVDSHCQGNGKCCRTSCGGTTCTLPVTAPSRVIVKSGSCPAQPTGRWVCSSVCSTDSNCRGTKKCCKNRCGAMACQRPEVEVMESVEIPVMQPDVAYSSDAYNPNAYNPNAFNPNVYNPNVYNPNMYN